MASNRRSRLITHGIARSPNRAMLRAVGFGDGDFEKPIVGVANGHSTMNPCNAGIQPLVDRAMEALKANGALPQVFGVPPVTDGIGLGPPPPALRRCTRCPAPPATSEPWVFSLVGASCGTPRSLACLRSSASRIFALRSSLGDSSDECGMDPD